MIGPWERHVPRRLLQDRRLLSRHARAASVPGAAANGPKPHSGPPTICDCRRKRRTSPGWNGRHRHQAASTTSCSGPPRPPPPPAVTAGQQPGTVPVTRSGQPLHQRPFPGAVVVGRGGTSARSRHRPPTATGAPWPGPVGPGALTRSGTSTSHGQPAPRTPWHTRGHHGSVRGEMTRRRARPCRSVHVRVSPEQGASPWSATAADRLAGNGPRV